MLIKISLFTTVHPLLAENEETEKKGILEEIFKEGKKLFKKNDFDKALKLYNQALSLDPDLPEAHYFLGTIYLKKNELQKGIEHIKKSIELAPDNIKIRQAIANLYIKKGLQEEALELLNQVLSLDPDNYSVHYRVGTIYLKKNQFQKGINHIKKSIELAPDNLKLRKVLANLYMKKGLQEDALDQFDQIIFLDPENSEAYYRIGTIYAKKNRLETGVEYIKKSIKLAPDNIKIRQALANIYLKKGFEKRAIQELKEIITLFPENKEAEKIEKKITLTEGIFFAKTRRYKKAIEKFNTLLSINPDDITTLFNVGRAYLFANMLKEAEDTFNKIILIDPKNGRAYLNLGDIYEKTGRISEALEHLEKAVDIDPDNPDSKKAKLKISMIKGNQYLPGRNWKKALEEFQKVLAIDPKNIAALINVGKIYYQQRRLEDAEREFKKALKINPKDANAGTALGMLYIETGKADSLIKKLEATASEDRKNPKGKEAVKKLKQYYSIRASGFINEKNFEKALAEYKKIIEFEPNDFNAHFNSGAIYSKKGEIEQARKEYEEAVRINPESISGHMTLAKTYDRLRLYSKASDEYEVVVFLDKDEKASRTAAFQLKLVEGKKLFFDKQLDPAAKIFNEILEDYPNNNDAYFFLAEIHNRQEEYNEAVKKFQKIIELNPNDLRSLLRLALTYEQLSREQDALEVYEKVVSITKSEKVANNAKDRASKIRKRINGFNLRLSYVASYDDNLNLSNDPPKDIITQFAIDLSYNRKLKNYLRLNLGLAPSYSTFHDLQNSFINMNYKSSLAIGPYKKMNLTLGYRQRVNYSNFIKTNIIHSFNSSWSLKRKFPTQTRVRYGYSNSRPARSKFGGTIGHSAGFSVNQRTGRLNTSFDYSFGKSTNKLGSGNDFDNTRHTGSFTLALPLLPDLGASLRYQYSYIDYTHPDSNYRLISGGDLVERVNKQHSITLSLNYKLHKQISTFLNYSFQKNSSNLPVGFILSSEDIITGIQSSSLGSYDKKRFTLGFRFNF